MVMKAARTWCFICIPCSSADNQQLRDDQQQQPNKHPAANHADLGHRLQIGIVDGAAPEVAGESRHALHALTNPRIAIELGKAEFGQGAALADTFSNAAIAKGEIIDQIEQAREIGKADTQEIE